MLAAFFSSVSDFITNALTCIGQALGGGVGLIYDGTKLTDFGILVSIPVGAGLLWVGYHVLRRCITVRG